LEFVLVIGVGAVTVVGVGDYCGCFYGDCVGVIVRGVSVGVVAVIVRDCYGECASKERIIFIVYFVYYKYSLSCGLSSINIFSSILLK